MPLTQRGPWAWQPAAPSSRHCWQQPEAMGPTFLGGTPRTARSTGGASSKGPWAGMWLPAARMQLLMAQHLLEHWTPSPPSSQHVGTRFPSVLGYPMVSHTSTVVLAGRGPHLESHPCPSRGTSSAAPCSPYSWERGGTHGDDSKDQKFKPWVSKGFAGSKSSSPRPPAGWEGSPCPGAVPMGMSPVLPGELRLMHTLEGLCTHWCHPSTAGHWGVVSTPTASVGP